MVIKPFAFLKFSLPSPSSLLKLPKGRTIRKVMGGGGGGESPKKIHARENAKKKNSCKEEGKEKKFMQKEGPIVIFIQYIKSANKHVKWS